MRQMLAAESQHPWFLARLELARIWADKFATTGTQGIDVGCGGGEVALALTNEFGFHVTGIDLSLESKRECLRKNIPFLHSDASSLNLEDSSQDFLVAMDVLEHLENPREALMEWRRVLKPNGKLLITVPAHKFMWSTHDVNNHHFRRYSKKEIAKDLADSGFQEIKVRWWNSVFFPFLAFLRLTRLSAILGANEYQIPGRFMARLILSILKLEARTPLAGRLVGLSLVLEADSGKG